MLCFTLFQPDAARTGMVTRPGLRVQKLSLVDKQINCTRPLNEPSASFRQTVTTYPPRPPFSRKHSCLHQQQACRSRSPSACCSPEKFWSQTFGRLSLDMYLISVSSAESDSQDQEELEFSNCWENTCKNHQGMLFLKCVLQDLKNIFADKFFKEVIKIK